MRTIHAPKTRLQLRYRRHLRVRRKVSGTAERPRLVVPGMLEVRGLECRYGKVSVLKGISLEVRQSDHACVGVGVRHA